MVTNDIKEIKKIVYSQCLEKARIEKDIYDKEGYAKHLTKCEMKFRGLQKCYRHLQQFKNADISSYLSIIRNEDIEKAFIIAIRNSVVIDSFLICGNEGTIHAEQYFIKNQSGISAVEFVLKWKKAGAQICNYHNHPISIAAIPSDEDIKSLGEPYHNNDYSEWTIEADKYHIDIPDGFEYDDWGVVTPFDFFSYRQILQSGKTSNDLLSYNMEWEKYKLEGAKKYIDSNSNSYLWIELKLSDFDD